MKEIWRDVEGYEGLYMISNLGRVKKDKKIIRDRTSKWGYKHIDLFNKGRKTFRVHRLVVIAFLPNPEGKPHTNHINCDKIDNRLDNLEWATRSENMLHAYDKGLNHTGEKHHYAKLKECEVIEIKKMLKKGRKCKEIGDLYGVSSQTIGDINRGKSWARILDSGK